MNTRAQHVDDVLDTHGLSVSETARDQLIAWMDSLSSHGQKTNLTGTLDPARIAEEFIADSLQIVPLLQEEPASIIDVGSGAGIPGLILAATRPLPTLLVEPRLKRAMFLRHAIRRMALGDQVRVIQKRLEEIPQNDLAMPTPTLWVSRAVFAPEEWLRVVAAHAHAGDHCAVWYNEHPACEAPIDTPWALVGTRHYTLRGPGPRTAALYRFETGSKPHTDGGGSR